MRKILLTLLLIFPLLSMANPNDLPENFVYLSDVDPTILQEMRYAGHHNFIGRPIKGYQAKECILTKEAAIALKKVQASLTPLSFSLKVYDCYRPQMAVDDFVAWSKEINQQQMKPEFYPHVDKADFFKLGYVAEKSGHTRGSTVDLTIVPLDMGTNYDFMDELSHTSNKKISTSAQQHRQFLQAVMMKQGFSPYQYEWWHFTLKDEPYPNSYFNFPVQPKKNLATTDLSDAKQLLLVKADDWNGVKGSLQRYERRNEKKTWKAVGKPIPIVLGKNGIAWGAGIQEAGQIKKEGDLRTPLGIFKVSAAFGFAEQPEQIHMPYIPLTNHTVCVDDAASRYYNQIINQSSTHPDWHSAEKMRSIDVYQRGIVISYNHPGTAGAGSCIFMHSWRNAETGTAGCIAMSKPHLKKVLSWLNIKKKPAIAISPPETMDA